MPHHNTRDHRFAYISTGELTWTRATTAARRPEVHGRCLAPFVPVVNPKPITAIAPVVHNPLAITIDSDRGPAKSIVAKEMERCDKTAAALDRTFAICNEMNRRLGLTC